MKGRVMVFFIPLIFSGCGIGGYWMNGNPFISEPGLLRIESWVKANTSAEQRVQDSIDCKGNEVGLPIESQANLEAAMLPGEEDIKLARHRLFNNWQRCMLGKGYQYIGECYPNEISRSRPACGGP